MVLHQFCFLFGLARKKRWWAGRLGGSERKMDYPIVFPYRTVLHIFPSAKAKRSSTTWMRSAFREKGRTRSPGGEFILQLFILLASPRKQTDTKRQPYNVRRMVNQREREKKVEVKPHPHKAGSSASVPHMIIRGQDLTENSNERGFSDWVLCCEANCVTACGPLLFVDQKSHLFWIKLFKLTINDPIRRKS